MYTSVFEADMAALGEKHQPQNMKISSLPQILKRHKGGRADILCTGIKASARDSASKHQRKHRRSKIDCQAE